MTVRIVHPQIERKQVVANHKTVRILVSEVIDGRAFKIELENEGLDFHAIDEARKDACRMLDRAIRQHKLSRPYQEFLNLIDKRQQNIDETPRQFWGEAENTLDQHVDETLAEKAGYFYDYGDLPEVEIDEN